MTPRPYADLPADALADEITVCRECIQTTRDLKLRKRATDSRTKKPAGRRALRENNA